MCGLGLYAQLVDVWVEDAVHEAYGRRFVRILIWDLDVDFPVATLERCWLNGVSNSV